MASHQQAQFIHFEKWTPQEVANWLQGLDESVAQYVPLFKVHLVDGRKLLMLTHSDLEKMGICKLGHQELVLEAVDLLRSLRYTLETENLQSMALQLGCKARNVVAELQTQQGENDQNQANQLRRDHQRRPLSITVLSYVTDLLASLKNLVSWLDRAPFEGIYDICRLRNSVVKLGLEMVTVTQRENHYVDPEDSIIKSCRTLIECCDGLVRNTKDPLVIQPAALEQATIRKKQDEELGMNIQSTVNGIHGISCIKDLSPADMCSKIEKGDEVLQVNGQTVLGWQLKELVRVLKDKPKEVTLLLKKRPRHINPLGAMQNHRRLAAKHAQQAATLPKSLKKRRSREGDLKQTRPSLQQFVSSGDNVYNTKDKSAPEAEADGNDTDTDVFRSGSESPQYTLPVMPDAKQRRATVSGGSPTFERSSLIVEEPVMRPKSQAINKAERDAALAILAASQNSLKPKLSESGAKEGKDQKKVRVQSSDSGNPTQKESSEGEAEDSVFSSDKEEQQTAKAETDGKQPREIPRVATSTSVLSESSVAGLALPESPARTSFSVPSTVPQVTPSDNAAINSADRFGKFSSSAKCRPPSPVSAPPNRRKPAASRGASQKARDAGVKLDGGGLSCASQLSTTEKCPSHAVGTVINENQTVTASTTHTSAGLKPASAVAHSDSSSVSPEKQSEGGEDSGSRGYEDGGKPVSASGVQQSLVLEVGGRAVQDHRPHSLQQAIHTEVATDHQDKDAPRLTKITKLESPTASDVPIIHGDAPQPPKQKKTVEFSSDTKESSPPPEEVSYTHIVVAGVVQRIPVNKANSTGTDSPPVKMRQKSGSRRLDRRVSCKDLGKGDCEGWLYKRKEKDRTLSKHWHKRWCVLKSFNLYYYKHKEDLRAEGVIYLPAFQVSPSPDLKTKKFPFKVHNAGTTFVFASERQDDMSKWMNKMGLAAISFDTSQVVTTGGFIKPEPRSNHLGVANAYYSESEEEGEEGVSQYGSALSLNSLSSLGSATTPQPSPPVNKRGVTAMGSDPGSTLHPSRPAQPAIWGARGQAQSVEDLHTVLRAIHSQDLTVDGTNRRQRRTQLLSSIIHDLDGKHQAHVAKMRELLALKRNLKVKEQELQDIEQFISSTPTWSQVQEFVATHPVMEH